MTPTQFWTTHIGISFAILGIAYAWYAFNKRKYDL